MKRRSVLRQSFTCTFVVSLWAAVSGTATAQDSVADVKDRPAGSIRVATFNVSMNRAQPGALLQDLHQADRQIQQVAAILRIVQPDIVLLNEFDFDATQAAAEIFRQQYLMNDIDALPVLNLPYQFSAPVNTGIPSGLDLNRNGVTTDAADAFGFGQFPGQYGMLLLSRFPIETESARTFRKLKWSAMPDALQPRDPSSGESWYEPAVWQQLRLSSKSHWDVPVQIGEQQIHILASHPTPPAFDGAEDRNGCRNHDEIRFWTDYISPEHCNWIVDDSGRRGGLPADADFVITGDLNSDSFDGGSRSDAIRHLLQHSRIRSTLMPVSDGGKQASQIQQGQNRKHLGPPEQDTADFNDRSVGNLRVDYVLPSVRFTVLNACIFWPTPEQPESEYLSATDHRLVWLDLQLPSKP